MRKKLLVIIALGVTLAIVAAGTASSVSLGAGDLTSTVPGDGTTTVLPQCADLTDNDGDGRTDMRDAGCSSPLDDNESDDPPSTGGSGGGTTSTTSPTTTSGGATTTTGKAGKKGKAAPVARPGVKGLFGKQNKKGKGAKAVAKGERQKIQEPTLRNPDGSPSDHNPSLTVAQFGPAPIGVPNFLIDSFEIPPLLLPIYQSCGTQYGIPWQVLASINKIETAFGTNLNVSTAGAVGWMQFIPSTWKAYGVDANADGRKDPYNPVDAICAAARYLRAAGGDEDLRTAIFAYNHADWYVDEVLLYARSYGKLPQDLLSSLTGLTEGAHFPVAADARYADDISTREALRRAKPQQRAAYGNAAEVVTSSPTRRGINIFSHRGAPIVAVNDGVIKAMGESNKLGKYIVLQDAYGNRFPYAQLGHVVRVHPVPKPHKLTAADFKLISPPDDAKPNGPATDTDAPAAAPSVVPKALSEPADSGIKPIKVHVKKAREPRNSEDLRPRLYALPDRPHNRDRASLSGQLDDLAGKRLPGYETFKNYFNDVFGFDAKQSQLRPLRVGSKVIAGTVLGRMSGPVAGVAPHINFSIRPAGRGAPRIDPKPIRDGWKLLEATAIYRAAGKDPFAANLGVGGVLLLSKEALQRRVLADPRLEIYSCGRTDIRSGQIDRRILAAMEYLVEKGYRLTITSLRCGHSYLTSSGNVSEHTSGNAMDIAMINGIPVTGHQGPGTLADSLIKSLLELQGTMAPHQLISLEDLPGEQSFALADHYDHVHVGYYPLYGNGALDKKFVEVLKPDQWQALIKRLGEIDNPTVPVAPSKFSLPAKNKGKAGDGGTAAN